MLCRPSGEIVSGGRGRVFRSPPEAFFGKEGGGSKGEVGGGGGKVAPEGPRSCRTEGAMFR